MGESEMGSPQQNGRMEGWLYLIRSNRFGLQYSRKRYFILQDNALNCFKSVPSSRNEVPRRSAAIDSCLRVTDNGRESINKNVFFIFTLYNSSNHSDQVKLGARSSEEAAGWIRSLMEAAVKECPNCVQNIVACSKRKWQPFRLSRNRERKHMRSIDWTVFSSVNMEPTASDVIAPSTWTIFGCKNGLRLFKEAEDSSLHDKYRDDHPAVMAVGVVDASSEAIFQTVMSLGPSRSEWDFCFDRGNVVDHLDGHTDIIHKRLKDDWLPWGMKRRDLLVQRCWRREDDGTYVILYHSVFHEKCQHLGGYIRACLQSGGYVISPINRGKQSVVKHMLAIDWKLWKPYIFTSSSKYVTIKMLGRVAALREVFKARLGNCCEFSSDELKREIVTCQKEERKEENSSSDEITDNVNFNEDSQKSTENVSGSFIQLNDESDEFFDVPERSEDDDNSIWHSDLYVDPQDKHTPKLTAATDFVKKLHGLADVPHLLLQSTVQKKALIGSQEVAPADKLRCITYGATLTKDPICSLPCSWASADPTSFLIRGETYLQDHNKIKATDTLMQMVAADWLKSDKREDDLAGRPNSIVQKYASQGGNEFFFVINIQVPGSTTYGLALYYMMDIPLEKVPLLESFVKGDDAYRNSRFKLIPYISKGSWIVKQSVGKKACLVGQALEINYFQGRNYMELGIDIGSSTVARGVVSLVLGYLNNLVIELAFLIQANHPEELPEFLLGTCRLNHLDASKAILAKP